MNGINLLPWREERRRARDRRMIGIAAFLCLSCVLCIFAGFTYLKLLQNNQKERNTYLQNEINVLDSKLEEIKGLQSRKKDLITRMEVIQDLQRERSRIVQVFDDMVQNIPEGVFFDSLVKQDLHFTITGTAQSNARVSNLMGNLDASDWFGNPYLSVINVTPSDGVRLSEFSIGVTERARTGRIDPGGQGQAARAGNAGPGGSS